MKPIRDKVKGLRQRQRANGKWRIWWEPTTAERALGFAAVDLDPDRPTWSIRQARQLNDDVARAARGDASAPARSSGGRSMDALIEDYRRSRHYKKLRPTTRRSYDINLNAIAAKWGSQPVVEFSKPVVNTWYETLLANSGTYQAQALVRMMSILFSHAERRGWRPEQSNPCFRLQMESGAKRGRHATWEEFDALIASADALGMPAMAAAIALATLNSQRQTDLIGATIEAFRDVSIDAPDGTTLHVFAWELVRSKRSTHGILPVHEEAAPRIRALIDAAAPGQTALLIDHATRRPFTGDLFRDRWAQIRDHAADAAPSLLRPQRLQFRDLRRTFGVWARAGGASKNDVADVLGNSAGQDPGLGETYMPATFHTAARAVAAIQRPKH